MIDALLSFAAGFGVATLLFILWLRKVRSDRDFWHRLYRSADESRHALVINMKRAAAKLCEINNRPPRVLRVVPQEQHSSICLKAIDPTAPCDCSALEREMAR